MHGEERRQAIEAYQKSGLTQEDFCKTWGITPGTLIAWLKKYREHGPKGLEGYAPAKDGDKRKGRKISQQVVDEILRIKSSAPKSGLKYIKQVLSRFKGVNVSTGSIRKTLDESDIPPVEREKKRHRSSDKIRFFERALPMQLWQSDITSYNKDVRELLEQHKVIHLRSLPRMPQHNGAVEVGIKELREIMSNGETNLKTAMDISNNRLNIYGNKWSTPSLFFENADMPYNKNDHDLFYFECSRRLMELRKEPLSFRQMRLKEREIIFEELEKRGFVTKWKVTKYG
ncbi:MAG: helix-turn-helix domain-containing protein [Bacteriovoracaceae bacterium]